MKILFFFFAALNVAIYLWQSPTMGESGAGKKRLTQDERVATLVLLREAENVKNAAKPQTDQQVAMRDSTANDKPPESTKYDVCYSLGPFEKTQQLRSAAGQLQELGAHVVERKQKEEVTLGFWVFLPSYPSWQDARKVVVELEKKGVKDMFVLGRGEMKNAVSLGLFKNEDGAERRLAKLKSLGITPRVEKQYSTKDILWLEVNVERNKDAIDSTLSDIAESDETLEMKTRSCQ